MRALLLLINLCSYSIDFSTDRLYECLMKTIETETLTHTLIDLMILNKPPENINTCPYFLFWSYTSMKH